MLARSCGTVLKVLGTSLSGVMPVEISQASSHGVILRRNSARAGVRCRSHSSSTDTVETVYTKPTLTLFTKDGCTLCDLAMDKIQDEIDEDLYSLNIVDIMKAGNETWRDRYQYDIPVFHLNGRFLMKHRADCELLASQLAKWQ